jgi:hypothetical protein
MRILCRANVIGEIKGSLASDKFMIVMDDSWDLGDGSQDDGAGSCGQRYVEFYKSQKTINLKYFALFFIYERRKWRKRGKICRSCKGSMKKHIFAMESDSYGFTPRDFL